MCPYPPSTWNMKYIRDRYRGRGFERFDRLEKFAYKRWMATHDMRRARQWLALLEDIKARR
jgi:hypothetical protein